MSIFALLLAAASDAPSIQTPQGLIIGRQVRSNVSRFSGIPYAAPPLGSLRFARAVLNTDLFGTLNATEFGAPCIQSPAGDPRPPHHLNAPAPSENCLFLNLWVPSSAAQNTSVRRPVLVYIFGGGLCSGYTGAYDGANIAATNDIIVASISYRLGPLGFLVDDAAFGDGGSGGMNGVHDVIVGLTWLRNNIGYFGGDGGSVTLFGQSSGSYLICTLCVSPRARGLFHRAILQSGPCIGGPPGKGWGPGDINAGVAATRGVMELLNVSTIAELRAADAGTVQWPDALMNDPKVRQILHSTTEVTQFSGNTVGHAFRR
jgi:para-nitrobenzyl esterase